MMHIHLISDRPSLSFSRGLIEYIKPYLGGISEFHLHEWEGDAQLYWTWEELFFAGKTYKDYIEFLGKSSQENYFIFLFEGFNEFNWFAAHDPEELNVGFIQCSGWGQVDFARPVFPVSYHLGAMLIIMKFFGNEEPIDFYHPISRGCLFDFTQNKEEVRFKFQSAHICESCISKISERATNKAEAIELISAVVSLFRSVKENLFPIDLQDYFGELDYRLVIGQDAALVLQVDKHKITLPISNGKEKALFITLLKHENGLAYKDFERDSVLREFLLLYYNFFVNKGSFESLYRQKKQQIEDRTFRNQLQPLISRMRKKLQETLAAYPHISEALSIHYRQGKLLIPLQRKRLDDNLNKSQL
ncbi:hypothetical protein MMU07_03510 [Aquiflexum sp. LQ15W]|uniref:hypothetical protein n=1 Tax=Cognataquiflexum nitidum TaxID=2922272 RepID=UPI001F13BB05|nr:hypothetical protein [Cognataquiflexum nitidum]MCH6198633.1 hypothetical protein [Cognataquiflexum nitidum]